MADAIPQWAISRAIDILNGPEGQPWWSVSTHSDHKSVLNLARYIAAREEPPVDAGHTWLELACGAVADAVFYHSHDTTHRSKLALALIALAREIRGIQP